MLSSYAVKCGNCRCEYDTRSYQTQDTLGSRCPSCGYLLSAQEAQMQYLQSQMQLGASNQTQWQRNQLGMAQQQAGLSSGLAGMQNSLSNQAIAQHVQKQMQANGVVPKDFVPELVEYENRVAAIKPYEFVKKGEKMGMFGLFVKRKEMELELKKLADNLDHHKRNEEMRIAEAVQKERLKANEQVSKVTLEAEAKVKKVEADTLLKITELQGKFTREKSELQAQNSKELAEAKAKAAEDYYEKMSKAMTELHQNGDKNSKFIQELALTMVKKAPKTLPAHARISAKGSIKDLKQLESDE